MVVVSSAIRPDNPEIEAARGARVPVVRRAEMLGELMRLKWAIAIAGTHGKTTTTSLIAALLDAADLDPTVINGGIINAYGTNARHGQSDWMVVEADESDGTFVRLPASIAVVTNIDPEHLDFYGNFDAVRAAFQSFLENLPFYGFAALCIDHPEVQALFSRITDRRLISYGFSPQADVRALDPVFDPNGAEFDVELRDRVSGLVVERLHRLRLAMAGRHNVQNALAAIAVARELVDLGRGAAPGAGPLRRRQAALHPDRHGGRHHRDRRLRPSSGRDPRRARDRAPGLPGRGSSRWSSRIATAACSRCSRTSAPPSTMPTACWSPRSMPPARRRSRASIATRWSTACAATAIATCARSMVPSSCRRWSRRSPAPGDLVVCLGAGSITAWANALPDALKALRAGEHAA